MSDALDESSSRPINVGVCPECEKRTLHYTDTAECLICLSEVDGNE
jgi:hypothetical protein